MNLSLFCLRGSDHSSLMREQTTQLQPVQCNDVSLRVAPEFAMCFLGHFSTLFFWVHCTHGYNFKVTCDTLFFWYPFWPQEWWLLVPISIQINKQISTQLPVQMKRFWQCSLTECRNQNIPRKVSWLLPTNTFLIILNTFILIYYDRSFSWLLISSLRCKWHFYVTWLLFCFTAGIGASLLTLQNIFHTRIVTRAISKRQKPADEHQAGIET